MCHQNEANNNSHTEHIMAQALTYIVSDSISGEIGRYSSLKEAQVALRKAQATYRMRSSVYISAI
jgi:hypothetical protein